MSDETLILTIIIVGRTLLALGLAWGGYFCVKTGWSTYSESIRKITGEQAQGGGEHSFNILGIFTINSKSKEAGVVAVLTSCVWVSFAYACIPTDFQSPGGYRFAGPGDVKTIDGHDYVLVRTSKTDPEELPQVYATPGMTPEVFGPERKESDGSRA